MNRLRASLALLALGMAFPLARGRAQEPAPTTPSNYETLVSSASRYAQTPAEAPASVSIVTREEIRRFGYRTLADILGAVRGFFTSYDRNYTYLTARGLARQGDFNTRFLLMVDGHRLNDAVSDNAYLGTESLVDLESIERVEVIHGPGSSLFGTNAFYAVINVITRSGREARGVAAGVDGASFGSYRGSLAWGGQIGQAGDAFVSGEVYRSEGQDYVYPEFGAPATNNGRALGLDRDAAERALAKARLGDFQLEGAISSRRKRVPTAAYSTTFDDDRFRTRDRQAFAALSYEHPFEDLSRLFLTASYNWYRYDGAYPYASALTRDYADADWVTLDGQYLRLFGSGHTVSVGGEARWNSRQAQGVYDVNPSATYLRDRRSSSVYAGFVQTALRLAPRVLLYAGVRHDRYEGFGGTTNPRGSLVIGVDPRTSVKLLYGRAFRAPNSYERFYQDGGATQKPAPGLRPEVVETYEFAASRELGHGVRAEASLYRLRVQRLIGLTTDPADSLLVYRNLEQARSTGVEVELSARLAGGMQGRVSYAYQHGSEGTNGTQPVNSPRHLARVGVSVPAWGDRVVGSAEVRYASGRPTRAGDRAAGHALTNFTLLARPVVRGPAELSLSVYNLFGTRYDDPGGEEHAQDLIRQDGRSFRAGLRLQF